MMKKRNSKIENDFSLTEEQEKIVKAWWANAKPGEFIEFKSAIDLQYQRQYSCRQQSIECQTGFTMALDINDKETSQAYLNITLETFNYGIPKVILLTKEKYTEFLKEHNLLLLIFKYFGIIITSINLENKKHFGRMMSVSSAFLLVYYASKVVKNFQEAKIRTWEIKKIINKRFRKEKPNFSHLKQITPFEFKVFSMNLKEVYIKKTNQFEFMNKKYQVVDSNNSSINLTCPAWSIVAFDDKKQVKHLIINKSIYKTIELK